MKRLLLAFFVLLSVAVMAQIAITPGQKLSSAGRIDGMPAGKIYINQATIPRPRLGTDHDVVGPNGEAPCCQNTATQSLGSFREECRFSHSAFDDPIVKPRESGATHLHTFYGNTTTDAQRNAWEMDKFGKSTCQGGTANRTGYWSPPPVYHCPSASMGCDPNLDGTVVATYGSNFYYKIALADPERLSLRWYPNGFRFVTGNSVADAPTGLVRYDCYRGGGPAGEYPDYTFDHIPTADEAAALHRNVNADEPGWGCDEIVILVSAPDCWDGLNLYLPSSGGVPGHMTYATNEATGRQCLDPAFPVAVPPLGSNIHIPVVPRASINTLAAATKASDVRALMAALDYWKLSSDQPEHTGTTQSGSTTTSIHLANAETGDLTHGLIVINGQRRRIVAWSSGSKLATLDTALTSAPAAGVSYRARTVGGWSGHFDWANGWNQPDKFSAGSSTTVLKLSIFEGRGTAIDLTGGEIHVGTPGTGVEVVRTITAWNQSTKVATISVALPFTPTTETNYIAFPTTATSAEKAAAAGKLNYAGFGHSLTDQIRAACYGTNGIVSGTTQGHVDLAGRGIGQDCHNGGLSTPFNDGVPWGLN